MSSTNHEKTQGGAKGKTGEEQEEPEEEDLLGPIGPADKKKIKQAQKLANLAMSRVELSHTASGDTYATLTHKGRRDTLAIGSRDFRRWLDGRWEESFGGTISPSTIAEAITRIDSKASRGQCRPVHSRVAKDGSGIYLDLANEAGEVVQIDGDGWRIIRKAPVLFLRGHSLLSLPAPIKPNEGTLGRFRALLNVRSDADFLLLLGWLVGAMHPEIACPMLVLVGEQGTAKSTMSRMLRSLVDPSLASIRGLPTTEDDLIVACENSRVVAFDNVSYIPKEMSDLLCGIITGSSFTKRRLYTNGEEYVVTLRAPLVVNGINNPVRLPDLLQRSIVVELEPIKNRRTEREIEAGFEAVHPEMLGLLCNAISTAIYSNPDPPDLPRMADFARVLVGAESAFARVLVGAESAFGFHDKKGPILDAYKNQIKASSLWAVENSDVARAVVKLAKEGEWQGTYADLLSDIKEEVVDHAEYLPRSPQAMSRLMNRLAPALREQGVEVAKNREGGSGSRTVTLRPFV